jgi:hypothetical protein
MQREDVPSDITNSAFEFFFRFSRFEFALKENGYLESHSPGAKADPGWREFVERLQSQYSPSDAAKRLVALSPKEQVVGRGDSLKWEPVVLRDKVSELKEVVYLLKTVRNNLFHGGKHSEASWDDPVRMKQLLSTATTVLDELATLAAIEADYRRYY